jgi:hypothetical protein
MQQYKIKIAAEPIVATEQKHTFHGEMLITMTILVEKIV